jgi:ribosomal protein S18 acetylase RimI-like enzyme
MPVLTAPGVTTVVAVGEDVVIGFAEVFSDGEIQAFLANVAVAEQHRGQGVGRALVQEALRQSGAERMDLLSEDAAVDFYASFPHFRKPGFRLYPFHRSEIE